MSRLVKIILVTVLACSVVIFAGGLINYTKYDFLSTVGKACVNKQALKDGDYIALSKQYSAQTINELAHANNFRTSVDTVSGSYLITTISKNLMLDIGQDQETKTWNITAYYKDCHAPNLAINNEVKTALTKLQIEKDWLKLTTFANQANK